MDSQLRLAQQLFYRDRADKDRAVDYALKTIRAGNYLDVSEFVTYIPELDAIIQRLKPEQITIFGISLISLVDCAFLPISRGSLPGETQQLTEHCRLKILYYPNYKIVGVMFEVHEPSYPAYEVRFITRYDPTPETLQFADTGNNSFPEEIAEVLDLYPDDINVTHVRAISIESRILGVHDHNFIYRPADWIGGARWEFLSGHPSGPRPPEGTYMLYDFERIPMTSFGMCHTWTVLREQFFENRVIPTTGWFDGDPVYIPRNIAMEKLQIEPISDRPSHRRLGWHRDNFVRILTENSQNIPTIVVEYVPGLDDQYRLAGEHYNPEQRAALVAIQQLQWSTVPVLLHSKTQIQPVPAPVSKYY